MVCRSTKPSKWDAAASILQEDASAIEAPESSEIICGTAPSEAVLIEVEAGAAAAARAAAAGEAAVKLVVAGGGGG